jgi:hypothetical protein
MKYYGQMRNQTYRSVFLSRVGVLDAFIGLLWAIQVVNWVTSYRLNSALGLIPRRCERNEPCAPAPVPPSSHHQGRAARWQ